jgi:hypothetical protein
MKQEGYNYEKMGIHFKFVDADFMMMICSVLKYYPATIWGVIKICQGSWIKQQDLNEVPPEHKAGVQTCKSNAYVIHDIHWIS